MKARRDIGNWGWKRKASTKQDVLWWSDKGYFSVVKHNTYWFGLRWGFDYYAWDLGPYTFIRYY